MKGKSFLKNCIKRLLISIVILIMVSEAFSSVLSATINYSSLLARSYYDSMLKQNATVIHNTKYVDAEYSAESRIVPTNDIKIYNYGTRTTKELSGKTFIQPEDAKVPIYDRDYRNITNKVNYFKRTDSTYEYMYYSFVLGTGDSNGWGATGNTLTNVATILYKNGILYEGNYYDIQMDIKEIKVESGFSCSYESYPCFNIYLGKRTRFSYDTLSGAVPTVGVWMKRNNQGSDDGGIININVKYTVLDSNGNEKQISGINQITDIDRNQGFFMNGEYCGKDNTFIKYANGHESSLYAKNVSDTFNGTQYNGTFIYSTEDADLTDSNEVDLYKLLKNKSSMDMIFQFNKRTAYSSIKFTSGELVKKKYNQR